MSSYKESIDPEKISELIVSREEAIQYNLMIETLSSKKCYVGRSIEELCNNIADHISSTIVGFSEEKGFITEDLKCYEYMSLLEKLHGIPVNLNLEKVRNRLLGTKITQKVSKRDELWLSMSNEKIVKIETITAFELRKSRWYACTSRDKLSASDLTDWNYLDSNTPVIATCYESDCMQYLY